MYNTIIIGGGVAGLTAGMYLARANKPALILESRFWGGQTTLLNKVDNYPAVAETSGYAISQTLYSQVKSLEIDMRNEVVTKVKQLKTSYQVVTNKDKYLTQNIIIATGAKTTQLGLKEEQKFIGRGVSYCATCDGNFFKNKKVAVYGLGKTALEDIRFLQNVASHIYWVIPNKSMDNNILQEIKPIKNLTILNSYEITSLIGDRELNKILLLNKKTNQITSLDISGLFISLGRQPDLSWLDIEVKTNKNGYIQVDKNCQTSHKGIFACGDITSRELKQIVTACSDGAIASSYIIKKG